MSNIDKLDYLNQLINKDPSFAPHTILAFDEAQLINTAAETHLDAGSLLNILNINVENQFDYSMPELVEILAALCKTDLALGLGYILTTFMAVTNIWVAGSSKQKEQCNHLLQNGKKIAIAYHELNHGNDFVNNELSATKVDGGYQLNGKKQIINNISRAGAVVIQVRTADPSQNLGAKSHSLFFIDFSQLDQNQYNILARYSTQGVHSCQIEGIEFKQCFISDETLLGQIGYAFNYGLSAFQITRAVLPAASLGTIETAIKITTEYCSHRILYQKNLFAIPNIRALLIESWLEYSIAQNLSYTTIRALHVLPKQMCVLASLAKAHIPLRMRHSLKNLALILGSRYYIREGEAKRFEKIMRDYPIVSLGHSSSFTCQATILPQLTLILKKFNPPKHNLEPILTALFQQTALCNFDIQQLRIFSNGEDTLWQSLYYWIDFISSLDITTQLSLENKCSLLTLLNDLKTESERISRADFNTNDISSFDYLEKYMWIQCAMATVGRWYFDQSCPFYRDDCYLIASLDLIAARLNQTDYFSSPSTELHILDYVQQI